MTYGSTSTYRVTFLYELLPWADNPDKSGEICFGLVKYFNFFLINMFKLLQKYKNVW